MRKLVLAAAAAIALASPASAQQYRVSPFSNGMGFAYGPNGQHETYVFRNGDLFANGNMTPAQPSPAPMLTGPCYTGPCLPLPSQE